ncbi:MAG: hypothetical protein E7638_08020 [Ruminococcaceae bacterium]|nr:hypothetical protein [Oscillospiraceae bacterium]
MFNKFKRIMKLREGKQLSDEEWNEAMERQGGLEKNDFLAMVLSALIVILPVCLILLGLLVGVFFLFF